MILVDRAEASLCHSSFCKRRILSRSDSRSFDGRKPSQWKYVGFGVTSGATRRLDVKSDLCDFFKGGTVQMITPAAIMEVPRYHLPDI